VVALSYSLEGRITDSVRQLGDLLLAVKGQGQVSMSQPAQRNQVAAEADEVLRPLMDLLDGELIPDTKFHNECDYYSFFFKKNHVSRMSVGVLDS